MAPGLDGQNKGCTHDMIDLTAFNLLPRSREGSCCYPIFWLYAYNAVI